MIFDYGDSRTGLATCDRTEFLTTAITPQITLKARNKVAARVCEVAKEIEAEMILIGLPLNMDGTEGERAAKSRKLAKTSENAEMYKRPPMTSASSSGLWMISFMVAIDCPSYKYRINEKKRVFSARRPRDTDRIPKKAVSVK